MNCSTISKKVFEEYYKRNAEIKNEEDTDEQIPYFCDKGII